LLKLQSRTITTIGHAASRPKLQRPILIPHAHTSLPATPTASPVKSSPSCYPAAAARYLSMAALGIPTCDGTYIAYPLARPAALDCSFVMFHRSHLPIFSQTSTPSRDGRLAERGSIRFKPASPSRRIIRSMARGGDGEDGWRGYVPIAPEERLLYPFRVSNGEPRTTERTAIESFLSVVVEPLLVRRAVCVLQHFPNLIFLQALLKHQNK
jgi:hypothetical protein